MMATWKSFKDRKGNDQPFEVTENHETLLNTIEKTLGAMPLVANTPKDNNVTVCYRFQNGIEIGLMLLENDRTTVYLNEHEVKAFLSVDKSLNQLISSIEKEALLNDLKKETSGRIYPHFKYKNPNTTVLRKEVKTLSPTIVNRLYVISGLEPSTVNLICDLVSDHLTIGKDKDKYSPSIGKKSAKGISPEELLKKLERQDAIGTKGEDFAIEYEKKRLEGLGAQPEHFDEYIIDRRKINVSQGYDIESHFDGQSRYIEVKTTSVNAEADFFFSLNEYKVLESKGDEAYIYRVVISEDLKDFVEIKEVKNPFDVKKSDKFNPIAFKASLKDFK